MEAPSELLLISAMLRTGKVLEPAQRGVEPTFFHTYKAEYDWILDYYARHGEPPSKAAFKTSFPSFRLLASDDLSHAIGEVKRSHAQQELIGILHESTSLIRSDQPLKAIEYVSRSVRELSSSVHTDTTGYDLLGDWSSIYDDVVERAELATMKGLTGVPTGIPTLDERTSGAQQGDLWLIAARLSMGKTWTLTQFAENAVVGGLKVLFVSLEQTWRQIAYRVHTIMGNRFGYDLRNTQLASGLGVDLNEYKSFLMALPNKIDGQLIINDGGRGRISPVTLSSLIEEHEPDVVFIDYITLMATSDGSLATEGWRAAASISADVKMVAMTYDIPIIAAAQINRLGEGGVRPPSVAKLAQTDSLGQDASVVVTMRRASAHVAQYSLEKHRHGESGVVFWTRFDPDRGEFKEVSYEEALDLIIDDEGSENGQRPPTIARS